MYKKILVPLDGSDLSECTLSHVKPVVPEQNGTEVILLRVMEPLTSNEAAAWAQAGYMIADVEKKNRNDAGEYLSKVSERLQQQGIAAHGEVIPGRAADAILDYAHKNNVELIIMSTHGRSGIARWAFGSVADKVVRSSDIPVLLITAPGCRMEK